MKIIIDNLEIEAIIGILKEERVTPQIIIIDIEATYDFYKTAKFIDYAQITQIVTNDIKDTKYELIEEALIGLKEILISEFPSILSLYIKLVKPNILPNCTVGISEFWNF